MTDRSRHDVRSKGRESTRGQWRGAWLALATASLVGCGQPQPGDEVVGKRTSALTVLPGEFSPNTPSFVLEFIGPTHMLATREGNNYNEGNIVTYSHVVSGGQEIPQWDLVGDNGNLTFYRPEEIWEGSDPEGFGEIYSAAFNSDFMVDSHLNGRVLPDIDQTPVGPSSSIAQMMSDGTDCSFGIYDNGVSRVINRSCIVLDNPSFWEDWGLELPTLQAPTLTPNASPIAYRRSLNSDSLSYPCAGGMATQNCEYRMGGPAANKTWVMNFGSGTFMTNTRPTAISNGYSAAIMTSVNFTKTNPDRFFFAATINGSTRSLQAKRETSAVDSATQPTYSTATIESTTDNVTYSTPMPYVRSDLKTGLVYLRTLAGNTTRVMETSWSGSAWSTPTQLYDTGVRITSGEPQPFVEFPFGYPPAAGRNTIVLRTPLNPGSTQVGDTILLQQGATATSGYSMVVLPPSNTYTAPNLFLATSAFNDPAWSKTNVTISGSNINSQAALGPNTTFTSELLRESGSGNVNHGVSQTVSSVDRSQAYRLVFYLKAETRSAAQLVMTSSDDSASTVTASVDLTSGLITSTSTTGKGQYLGSSVEKIDSTNNWFRVSLIGRPTTVVGAGSMTGKMLMLSAANGSPSYGADTSKGLFVWGGELAVYDKGNLVAAPSALNDSTWAKTNTTVTADATAAPDGTTTADRLNETTANNIHSVVRSSSAALSTDAYLWSVYLKAGSRTAAMLQLDANADGSSSAIARVDLTAGTIVQASGTGKGEHVSSSITAVGSGWFRVTLTGKSTTTTGNQVNARIFMLQTPTGSTSYTGSTSSNIFVWGGELFPVPFQNLDSQANAFDNSAWVKTRSSVTKTNTTDTTDPLGTNTAEFWREDASTNTHTIDQTVSNVAATRNYAWSCYLKAGVRTAAQLFLTTPQDGASGVQATVNLSNGTITSAAAVGTGALVASNIQPAGNGWYRVTIRGKARNVVGTQLKTQILMVKNGATNYAGDNASGIYLWGGELLLEN